MVRIRNILVLWVVLGLVLVAACKKDETKTGTGGDKTDKPSGSSGTAASDDLSLLPVDSELVLGINFAQVQQSALWKQFVEPRLMNGDAQKKLAEFKDKCGFDAMGAMKNVSVGLRGLGGAKPDGAIVIHGVDKAKSWECVDKMKDEMTKDGTEYTRTGDVGLFKSKNGDQAAVTFVSDNTALVVLGDKANPDGVKTVASGDSALKKSQTFVDMYSKVNTSDSVWFLVNGKVLEKGAAMGVKPKAIFGSINVTDGLKMDLRMRLETPDAATQFATMAKTQAQQAAKMFDQIDVTNDGSEVRFAVVLSSQKLQALIAQVGGMLGALGGMGTP